MRYSKQTYPELYTRALNVVTQYMDQSPDCHGDTRVVQNPWEIYNIINQASILKAGNHTRRKRIQIAKCLTELIAPRPSEMVIVSTLYPRLPHVDGFAGQLELLREIRDTDKYKPFKIRKFHRRFISRLEKDLKVASHNTWLWRLFTAIACDLHVEIMTDLETRQQTFLRNVTLSKEKKEREQTERLAIATKKLDLAKKSMTEAEKLMLALQQPHVSIHSFAAAPTPGSMIPTFKNSPYQVGGNDNVPIKRVTMKQTYINRATVSFDKLPEKEDSNEIYIYYTEDPQTVNIQDRAYKYLTAVTVFDSEKLSEAMALLPIEATAYCYIQGGHDEVVFKARRSPVIIH